MIVRGPRPSDNFAQIHNDALADGRLSFKARGVLAFLLSRPPGWKTSADRLAQSGVDGERAIKSALKELEATGYLQRTRTHDGAGKWVHNQVITDQPDATIGAKQPDGENGPHNEPTIGAFCTGGKQPDSNNTELITLISNPVVEGVSTSPSGEGPQTPDTITESEAVMFAGPPAEQPKRRGWWPSDAALKTADTYIEIMDIPLSIARYVIRKAEMKQEPSSSEWLRWLIDDEKKEKLARQERAKEARTTKRWDAVAD